MLRSLDDLENYALQATDGDIGHVRDFYFDDVSWAIRYLVVECGPWLSSRQVLISPMGMGPPNWPQRTLPVSITREQVRNSPTIDTEKPVSRQHEIGLLGHYGYPHYWSGTQLWGTNAYPGMPSNGAGGFVAVPQIVRQEREAQDLRAEVQQGRREDPHLRSCKALHNYRIASADGEIGHVQGLIVEEASWAVRYFIVNTSNWWLGHRVLIAAAWIRDVNWLDATITVDLTRKQVRAAPPYDSTGELNREREQGLFEHYGREAYWDEDRRPKAEFAED